MAEQLRRANGTFRCGLFRDRTDRHIWDSEHPILRHQSGWFLLGGIRDLVQFRSLVGLA